MDEKFYTPYSKTEILRAFERALGDLTDAQIFALVRNEASAREAADSTLTETVAAVSADLAANYARADALSAEAAARAAADAGQDAVLTVLADGAPKNAVNAAAVSGQTTNGITWTVNAEQGTITANGTATGNSFFYLWAVGTNAEYAYPTRLTGSPAGGSACARFAVRRSIPERKTHRQLPRLRARHRRQTPRGYRYRSGRFYRRTRKGVGARLADFGDDARNGAEVRYRIRRRYKKGALGA